MVWNFNIYLFSVVLCVHVQTHEEHSHKLSESEHYKEGGTHDSSYDHDAFLGKSHGHDFDDLKPEEAKRRLKELLKQVDSNGDGKIVFEELREWIDKQRMSYMFEKLDSLIARDDENKDGKISWQEYKDAHYGKWDGNTKIDSKLQTKVDKAYKKFKLADANGNGKMDRNEYALFRHPEESRDKRLQEIAVEELIDDMDQNGDRKIDEDEFLGQFTEENGQTPEWVIDDRKYYKDRLDKNKNGILDRDEIKLWVLPNREDTLKESKHLIASADDNEDGVLSVDEILDHYNLFVGSTATDHGKALRDDL